MSTENSADAASVDTLTVAALLAEYQKARNNYAGDPLVQAMAEQLARLAGRSAEQAAELAHVAPADAAPETLTADVVGPISGYLRVCRSGGMSKKASDNVLEAVSQAQELGYFDLLRAPACLDGYDRERLLHAGRVLRWIADIGTSEPIDEGLLGEVRGSIWAIKQVLRITEEQSGAYGLAAEDLPAAKNGSTAAGALLMGWRNAAVAWDVCASIHRTYGRGRDALFTTRQADYLRHAEDARRKYVAVLAPSTVA